METYDYAVRFADGSVDSGFSGESAARAFQASAQVLADRGYAQYTDPILVRRPKPKPEEWEVVP